MLQLFVYSNQFRFLVSWLQLVHISLERGGGGETSFIIINKNFAVCTRKAPSHFRYFGAAAVKWFWRVRNCRFSFTASWNFSIDEKDNQIPLKSFRNLIAF